MDQHTTSEQLYRHLDNYFGHATVAEMQALKKRVDALMSARGSSTHHNGITKSKAVKAAAPDGQRRSGPMRPVNSFMAFRSYYSPMLPPVTQKEKSSFIKKLWGAEDLATKQKWETMAKAYSGVRDNVGKINAPFDEFLNKVAPSLEILTRDEYFSVLGWKLVEDGTNWELQRTTPTLRSKVQRGQVTLHDTDDVIAFYNPQLKPVRGAVPHTDNLESTMISMTAKANSQDESNNTHAMPSNAVENPQHNLAAFNPTDAFPPSDLNGFYGGAPCTSNGPGIFDELLDDYTTAFGDDANLVSNLLAFNASMDWQHGLATSGCAEDVLQSATNGFPFNEQFDPNGDPDEQLPSSVDPAAFYGLDQYKTY